MTHRTVQQHEDNGAAILLSKVFHPSVPSNMAVYSWRGQEPISAVNTSVRLPVKQGTYWISIWSDEINADDHRRWLSWWLTVASVRGELCGFFQLLVLVFTLTLLEPTRGEADLVPFQPVTYWCFVMGPFRLKRNHWVSLAFRVVEPIKCHYMHTSSTLTFFDPNRSWLWWAALFRPVFTLLICQNGHRKNVHRGRLLACKGLSCRLLTDTRGPHVALIHWSRSVMMQTVWHYLYQLMWCYWISSLD